MKLLRIGQERHLVTSDMTTLMHLVTDHACSALHPCAAALNTTNTGWLPNARRVLAAARNALDCSSQQSATQPVSVSALSIMVEVSQRLETDVTEFWRSVLLETPIKRPIALQQLVERLLQGAQAHMDQSSLQHLQLSTYQQLIPHGASDAIVKSLTSGVPVVASALQLRSLVRGACKENSRCLLEALRCLGRQQSLMTNPVVNPKHYCAFYGASDHKCCEPASDADLALIIGRGFWDRRYYTCRGIDRGYQDELFVSKLRMQPAIAEHCVPEVCQSCERRGSKPNFNRQTIPGFTKARNSVGKPKPKALCSHRRHLSAGSSRTHNEPPRFSPLDVRVSETRCLLWQCPK